MGSLGITAAPVGHAEEMRPLVQTLSSLELELQKQYLSVQMQFGAQGKRLASAATAASTTTSSKTPAKSKRTK